MTIYLTGDTHGLSNPDDFDRFEEWNFPEGNGLTRHDYLIVLGDFGLPWDYLDNDSDLHSLNRKPWTTLFIDGNHEFFPYLQNLKVDEWKGGYIQRYREYPNIIHLLRGSVFDIDGKKLFCMGGAQSVDKSFQQSNGTWYEEEMPDGYEYSAAERNLRRHDWNVDFVLTHTCANRMLPSALGRNIADTGILTDELTGWLDKIEDKLAYRHWFFGHFHRDVQLDNRHSVLFQSIVNLDDYEA